MLFDFCEIYSTCETEAFWAFICEVASLEGVPSALCPALGSMALVLVRVAEQGASGPPSRLQQPDYRGDLFRPPDNIYEMINLE